jgi:chromosome segregation ATPase
MPTFGLLVLLGLSIAWIIYTKRERDRLRQSLRRYDSLASLEEFTAQLDSDVRFKQREFASLNEDHNRLLLKYEKLHSQEEIEAQLDSDIRLKQAELAELSQQEGQLEAKLDQLRQQVSDLEEEAYIQSFGFYQPKYDFISSGDYEVQLKRIKSEQKEMIRNNQAAICRTSWVVKDSEKEGQKLAKNFLKLVLTIFNGELNLVVLVHQRKK